METLMPRRTRRAGRAARPLTLAVALLSLSSTNAPGLSTQKSTTRLPGPRVRPNGASVGPDGNLYVAFLRAPAGDIQRVTNAASDAPIVEVVGHSDGGSALAAGYDAHGALTVYVA